MDKVTGGRAVVSGHILTDRADIFAANERGANFLLKNNNGKFEDVAFEYSFWWKSSSFRTYFVR